MEKIVKRVMEEWARKEKQKLGKEFCQLVDAALYDLWYGPSEVSWTSAMEDIRKRIENYDDLYVNIQFEEVFDTEPEEDFEDVFRIKRKDVLRYLIRELVEYL